MTTSVDGNISLVWKARTSMLMQFDAVLASHVIETRDQFTEILQAAFGHCGLSIKRFAGDMRVSQSTAHRWISGVSAPQHERMWNDAADWIRAEIQRQCDIDHSTVGNNRQVMEFNQLSSIKLCPAANSASGAISTLWHSRNPDSLAASREFDLRTASFEDATTLCYDSRSTSQNSLSRLMLGLYGEAARTTTRTYRVLSRKIRPRSTSSSSADSRSACDSSGWL